MADAKIEVAVVGNTKDFDKAMTSAEKKTSKFGSVVGGLGKAAVLGGAIGGVALLGKALTDSAGKAQESQQAQARMAAQLKALNIPLKDHADQISDTINKTSKLAAVDDEDLQDAFTSLLPATHNVGQALKDMSLAADIAAARHISLQSATQLVTKANTGSAGALRKIGISLVATHDNLDKARQAAQAYAKEHKGDVSPAMKQHFADLQDQARALDKSAQATKNLEVLQKTFAGAAKAYGDTSAGAQDKLAVAFENLQETVGTKVLPIMTKLSLALVDLIGWLETNWPKFQQVIAQTWQAVRPSIQAIIDILGVVKDTVQAHSDTIMRNFNALKQVVVDALTIVRNAIQLVNDLLHGKWGDAWNDAKGIVVAAIDAIKTLLINQLENIKGAALALGKAALNGIKEGLTGIGEFLLGVLTGLKDMLGNQLDDMRARASALGRAVLNGIKDGITGVGEYILGVLGGVKTMLENQVDDVRSKALAVGAAVINGFKSGAVGVGEWIAGVAASVVKAIAGAIGAVRDAAASFGGAILDGIGAGLRSLASNLGDWITAPINAVIGRINDVIGSINSALEIHIPSVNTHIPGVGKVGGQTIDAPDIPKIPKLATGGFVAETGLAVVHRGETFSGVGNTLGGNTYIFNLPNYLGSRTDVEAWLRQAANQFERRNGRPAFGGGA